MERSGILIGLALSGGGIRGIAYAGVLKALEENDIFVNVIGGTSAGALISSLYAIGYSPNYILEVFKMYSKEIIGINLKYVASGISYRSLDKKIGITGLKTGKSLEKLYNRLAARKNIKSVGEIEKLPLIITSVDIKNGKEYIFTNSVPDVENKEKYITNITIGKAVRASSSFPGVFCPCKYEGHYFFDGGILDNVPVNELKKQGADKVIAINFKTDDINEESNIKDLTMRTLDIMGNKISEECLRKSDIILTITTDKIRLFNVENLESYFQNGYDTVIKNIEKIKQILDM